MSLTIIELPAVICWDLADNSLLRVKPSATIVTQHQGLAVMRDEDSVALREQRPQWDTVRQKSKFKEVVCITWVVHLRRIEELSALNWAHKPDSLLLHGRPGSQC